MNNILSKTMVKLSIKTRIIIVLSIIIVFILTAISVSINIFIKAENVSIDAKILNQAVSESASIAESLKASDGSMEKSTALLRAHRTYELTDNSFILYYDENFMPSAKNNSCYKAVVTKSEQVEYRDYTINILQLTAPLENKKQNPDISDSSESKDKSIYKLSFKTVNTGGV